MRYERDVLLGKDSIDIIENLNDYYSDWRVINLVYNSDTKFYVAIIEREVEE